MNLLAWNCRGLGNQRVVEELGELIQAKDLKIAFFVRDLVNKNKDGRHS